MQCPVEHHETREDGKHRYRCPRCKRRTGWTPNPPENYHRECTKPGIGDYVAKALNTIGIVKKPGCGCKKRQEKLNALGESARKLLTGKSSE